MVIHPVQSLGENALKAIQEAKDLEQLEQLKVALLGKKGSLSEILKGLGQLNPQDRPQVGQLANVWKRHIEQALGERRQFLEREAQEKKLSAERWDVTLPSRRLPLGACHLVNQTIEKLLSIFYRLGFDPVMGPEVETEYFNFEAVNIPDDHPAREMQDTFFLQPGVVLRTHTSSVQMRFLKLASPGPLHIVCPGAVYRCDQDATHSPMFHQVEGLWVDQGVRLSDLKGTLLFWARELFGAETQIRIRPSYFPFVEPGAEVDVSCFQCRSSLRADCRICKGTGWLEVLGAGMVHPRLFEMAGYPIGHSMTGFAFGMGVERIAMLLHEIPDIRLFFQGDIRFLNQFL